MLITNTEEKIIKKEMEKLKNRIVLTVFTDFITNKSEKERRRTIESERVLGILNKLEELSQGKLNIKELSIKENQDKTEMYNIRNIPTIMFQSSENNNNNNKELIRYTANLEGNQLIPFLKSVLYYSGVNPFYKDQIITNLKNIKRSEITLFISQTCAYCPQVIPIVNSFAIISNGKIKVEIIDVNAHPDIAMKHKISGVPHTIINKKKHLYGLFSPQDLLDNLTMGKRDFSGMYS